MVEGVQKGPSDNSPIPRKSLGVIIYNELKKIDPSRILFIDSVGEEVSCGKLLQISANLARKLTQLGVQQEDVITTISQNHWKYIATFFAAFYVGAKVSLLNHDYTSGELTHFFSISQPSVVFCTSKTLPNLFILREEEFYPSIVIVYNDESPTPEVKTFNQLLEDVDEKMSFQPCELDPEEAALILTSSGTTGFPKCVALSHRSFRINLLYPLDPYFIDINETEIMLGFLPFFHIFGILVATASIIARGTLVILENFNPEHFLKNIQDHKVTKLLAVPPVLLFLVKSPLVSKYDLSSIRDVLSGAAPVSKELEDMVVKKLNVTSVRQTYGLTEAGGALTLIPKNVKRCGSVGKVVATQEVRVCDVESGKVLPPHQVGELRFKGGGMMSEYLGNENEFMQAFDGDGFLKSGDLGYYDHDGYFYIVDRLKEIIKYKGFQVSPVELENLLLQHPGVKDVGVVGKPDERAGELPLAFIVKQVNFDVPEEEIEKYIAEKLSVQKHLHGGVRFIDEIPKSASGKILRRKLKELLLDIN